MSRNVLLLVAVHISQVSYGGDVAIISCLISLSSLVHFNTHDKLQ